uniref:RT_RNaseH domain-containing protein n=1 Tax=Heterorhabditis bacteriophora TaxID=37862 RepID=A0A1I7WIC4_HETBA
MENQFKYLIFVCSLQAPSEADIRLKLLHKTKTEPKATLQILAEESHCLINLKHDTKLVEASNSAVIEAVKGKHEQNPTQYIPRESSQPDKGKSPPSPCWIFRYRLRTDHYNTKDMESLGFTAASEENHSSVRSELRETAHHWLVRVTIQTLGFAHKILSINQICRCSRLRIIFRAIEEEKATGSLRICTDFSTDDIFSILNGRKISSQIDLIDAYLHFGFNIQRRRMVVDTKLPQSIQKHKIYFTKNYGRIGKEGLALAFAVKKFHHILHGHHFKLFIEYKSLFSIFGSKKGIPVYTVNRLQQ